MAISFLEQRIAPLLARSFAFRPFGPLGLPPSIEILEENYGFDAASSLPAGRRLQRCHSWSGYPTYWQKGGPDHDGECESRASFSTAMRASGEDGDGQTAVKSTEQPRKVAASRSWFDLYEEEFNAERAEQTQVVADAGAQARTPAKNNNDLQEEEGGLAEDQMTAVIVKRVARKLTRPGFIEVLHSLGFQGRFNYVHLPRMVGSGKNQGYAFVNFTSQAAAESFLALFPQLSDKPLHPSVMDLPWQVGPAPVQGLAKNAEKAARSAGRLRNKNLCPLVL